MATVDEDRDDHEAYDSGLYSLQSEADSTEFSKGLSRSVCRRSVSPGRAPGSIPEMHLKQATSNPKRFTSDVVRNLKIPVEKTNLARPALNPETPMTQLAGQLVSVDLKNEQCESPSREFDSGIFPSMSGDAYNSMQPSLSLGKDKTMGMHSGSPETTEMEKMEVEDSGVISMSATSKLIEEEKSNNILSNSTLLDSSRLVSMQEVRLRSVSPNVPPVGESVEVMTDVPPPTIGRSKRAFDCEEEEWHRKKTRLSDVDEVMPQKPAIRVKTIVSPAGSPRPRRGGTSPHRSPRDSHSPVSISVTNEGHMDTSTTKQSSISPGSMSPNSAQPPVVNFRDIGDLAKSSNPDQQGPVYVAVNPHSLAIGAHPPSLLLAVSDITRHGQAVSTDSAVKQIITSKGGPLFPKKAITPASTAAMFQLVPPIPIASINRLSPTPSPRNSSPSSDKKDEKIGKKDDKDGKPGAGNALLQVTEAHLATLSDEDGDTPLHLAIIHENFELTQYLVKLIVGVYMNLDIANNMRQTPLHLAVITRQPQMVQLLVGAGASVNFPDRKGNTALHLAAARRDVRILQLLAQATNPLPEYNAKNFFGLTAIHVATKESSIDVLKFFFQMGSNKNTPDACSGRTALHYAVESENFTLVNFLLENNVNVNAVTFSGNTPLHVAAGRRLKEIVALLMAYGANPAIANGEGDFPSDLPASLLMQRAKMHNAH